MEDALFPDAFPEPLPADGACAWIGLRDALEAFALAETTESARHIKPLHWYVACRLVLEGGFHPDDVIPRPPFQVEGGEKNVLVHDPKSGGTGELTVMGGLKTKKVDVTVCKPGIGPCVAVSLKGTLRATRNLTNRMEEAAGDCTNLHLMYPALVYGFLHVLRANREGPGVDKADVAVLESGEADPTVVRYHDAMARLTAREDVRSAPSKYEAIAVALVGSSGEEVGRVLADYPPATSELRFERFLEDLYRAYDLRFVHAAPALQRKTSRLVWSADSPVRDDARLEGFAFRCDG